MRISKHYSHSSKQSDGAADSLNESLRLRCLSRNMFPACFHSAGSSFGELDLWSLTILGMEA